MSRIVDFTVFLSLPDHLRKTLTVIHELGRCTADMIHERTRKARAIESSYANVLVAMGLVEKTRNKTGSGRETWFSTNITDTDLQRLLRLSQVKPEILALAKDIASDALAYYIVVLEKLVTYDLQHLKRGRRNI